MRWLGSVLLCAGTAAAVVAGCGGGPRTGHEPVAEIYVAAIRWLVEDPKDSPEPARQRVFVEAVGEEPIPLSVQADVVNRLEDAMAVRFIDTRAEAIDTTQALDPVRDDGVLVGLGPVAGVDDKPVRLYVHIYRDVSRVVAYEMVLQRKGGRWEVTGEPRRVAVDEAARPLRG